MFEPSVASDYVTVEEEQGLPHGERALLLGSPNRIHIDILVSPCSSFCGVIGNCSDGFISLSSEFALLPSSAELGASLQSVDELAFAPGARLFLQTEFRGMTPVQTG